MKTKLVLIGLSTVVLIIAGFVLIVTNSTVVGTDQQSIDHANLAYDRYDYQAASDGYKNFMREPEGGRVEDIVLAARRLAYFEWHIEGNIKKANYWANRALELEYDRAGSLTSLSKYEMEAGNVEGALKIARKAEKEASTDLEKRLASEQFCNVILTNGIELTKAQGDLDENLLVEANTRINQLASMYSKDLDIAKTRLGIGLLNRDVNQILSAWKNYFHIDDNVKPVGQLGTALNDLSSLAINSPGRWDNVLGERLALALVDSKFFNYAFLAAKLLINDDASISEELSNAIAYHQFLERSEQLTYDFYKDLAKRKENQQRFNDDLLELEEEFWDELFVTNKAKSFSHGNFVNAIKRLFKAKLTQGRVNGNYAYYIWHEVSNESKAISQYGRKATLQLISMDYLVSNDYSGWFHNMQRVSGTATNNTVVVVRPNMYQGPISLWNQFTDPIQRKKLDDQVTSLKQLDLELVEKDQYALLPGMRLELIAKGLVNIYDSLNTKLENKEQLKLAFIDHIRQLFYHTTMYHEGRHLIDKRMGGFSSNEMEYRAKISEVVFSPKPLLTFAITAMRPESGNSSHGKANAELVRDMVGWMRENRNDIGNYDANTPMVLQVDKLSDAQVVAALRSLDPFARGQ